MTLLIRNAQVFAPGEPSAVLVADGRIAWIGHEAAAASLADEHETLDAGGDWLAPAFVDGHVHLVNTGLCIADEGVRTAGSEGQLRQALAALTAEDGEVVFAHGWDDSDWPTAVGAEALPPTSRPMYAARVDLHSALVNPALADLVPGLRSTPGWSEQGLVKAEAHGLVRNWVLERIPLERKLQAATAALSAAARNGVAAVHEMSGPVVASQAEAAGLTALGDSLPEVQLWWGELNGFDTAAELGAYGCGGDLFVDGSIGSETAWFHDPYASGASGQQYISEPELFEHVSTAVKLGVPTGFHAIGDAATELVAAAFTEAGGGVGQGHRVEHLMAAAESTLDQLLAAGVAASLQPSFGARWGGPGGMYAERLGERWRSLLPLGGIAKRGLVAILGSDSPVTPIDPWGAVAAAVNSELAGRLSPRAAFRAHTATAWRHAGRTDVGQIAVGQHANLALWRVPAFSASEAATGARWSTDPRSGLPRLPDLAAGTPECRFTMRSGQFIHKAMDLG